VRARTRNHKADNLTQSHTSIMKCKQHSLKCLYTNANSLINKMDELRYRAKEMDIIAVTETWATAEIKDGELDIEGYIMYRSDRQPAFPLSGVTAYLTHKILVKTHKKERQCVK